MQAWKIQTNNIVFCERFSAQMAIEWLRTDNEKRASFLRHYAIYVSHIQRSAAKYCYLWYIFAFFGGKWDSKIWHCNFFHLLTAWMPNLKISCRIFKHSQRSWERSGLINHHISYLLVPGDKVSIYRKVMSSSLSRLVAHPWISRLLMKGKFDHYSSN